jgi:hypothetical protein
VARDLAAAKEQVSLDGRESLLELAARLLQALVDVVDSCHVGGRST